MDLGFFPGSGGDVEKFGIEPGSALLREYV